MKIDISEDWLFFKNYHDVKYIHSHNTQKVVALKESGESRKYILDNPLGKELVVYKVDGGLIDNNKVLKCDYAIYTEEDILYLIELKGCNYIHALKQLLNTIDFLIRTPHLKVYKLNARIVLSRVRVPDIRPSQEEKLCKILDTYHGSFDKKCRVLTETV